MSELSEQTTINLPINEQPKPFEKFQATQHLLKDVNEIILEHKTERLQGHVFLTSEQKLQRLYIISNEQRQQLLCATMESIFCVRVGVGHVYHPTYGFQVLHSTYAEQDSMHLFRSLRCDACCCPISLQTLEVFAPPRHLFAIIEQQFNLIHAVFHIKNCNNEVQLKIVGQDIKMDTFKILTAFGTEVGTLMRKRMLRDDCIESEDAFFMYFDVNLHNEHKMLLLAAAILIDCMYEELPKFFGKP